MNATTFEKAAGYAVAQDTALTRLQSERDALQDAHRIKEAHGVTLAMQILRRMEVHIIPQAEWKESRR
jgi:hypothetical protein